MYTYFKKNYGKLVLAAIKTTIVLGFLGGCVSRKIEEGTQHPSQTTTIKETPDFYVSDGNLKKGDEKQAEALASFAAGLIHEIEGSSNALPAYLEALANDPFSSALYTRVASMNLRQNDPDEAIRIIKKGCELMPDDAELRMVLGHINSMLNRVEEAEKAYRAAIKIMPQDTNKYLVLASFLKDKGKYEEAMKVLDEALQNTKDTASILRLKGDMMLSKALGQTNALSSEDYQKITEYYEQSLVFTNDASSPQYYERLGDMHIQFRNYEKALKAYQSALIRTPDDEQLSKKVAMCFVAIGDRKAAADILKKIVKNDENDFNLLQYLGDLYESMGNLTNAAMCYDDAIKIAPSNSPSPYFKLAAIYSTTNVNKAIEILDAGVKAMPQNYDLVQTLATLYLQKQEQQNAMTIFETAEHNIEKTQQKPGVNFYIAYALTALINRDPDRALLNYDKAIELVPDYIDAYLMKAEVLKGIDDYDKASATLIEALAIQPGNPFIWLHYGILSTKMERYEEAISIFKLVEKLLKAGGENIENTPFYNDFLFAYASALERVNEYDKSEKTFLTLIERNPDDPEPFNYLAYMWAEQGKHLAEAQLLVEHALESEPENGAFLDTLGWIYFKKGNPAQAIDLLLQAAELVPKEPVIFEHIAEVYEKLNEPELACKYHKNAAEKWNEQKGVSTPAAYILELIDANTLLETLLKVMAGQTNDINIKLEKTPQELLK
jgi:tetratricopeptide (TPR) repeat protein